MRAHRDNKKIERLEASIEYGECLGYDDHDYYNFRESIWRGDDEWEWWSDWSLSTVRVRQEKLDEIFDLNKKVTLEDIWPDRSDLKLK